MHRPNRWTPRNTKRSSMEFANAPEHYPHGIRYYNPDGSTRYLRDTDKIKWGQMRQILAYCYLMIMRGEDADLYRYDITMLRNDLVSELLVVAGLDKVEDKKQLDDIYKPVGKGMTGSQVYLYACLCNRLEWWGVVFPPHITRHILYEDFTSKEYKFDILKEQIFYFFPNFWGNPYAFKKDTLQPRRDGPSKLLEGNFHNIMWDDKPYYPRYFLFFAENEAGDHSYLIACYANGYSTKKDIHYYKVQLIDSDAWVNLEKRFEDGKHADILSNSRAQLIADKLNELFRMLRYRHICFQAESFKKFFLKKKRQASWECAMFTCFHARYFVDGVPLFIGNNEAPLLRNVLVNELGFGFIKYDYYTRPDQYDHVCRMLHSWQALDRSMRPSISRYNSPESRAKREEFYRRQGFYIHPRHSYISPYSKFSLAFKRPPE